MHISLKALLWASAMILVAVAGAGGLISQRSAKWLILILPIFAVLYIRREYRCIKDGVAAE